METGKRVALALGSGGARGYAHIGVIEVLHERGYEIVTIAGSSMGALVGGLEAAEHLDVFSAWARTLTRRDVVGLFDFTFAGPGLMRAEKILDKVSQVLAGARIEDLPIPFTAVATDINARRPVWFQSGPLDAAIRASISIPGVFTPVVINGRLLADGGIVNPVPIEPTATMNADLTVAVSLTGSRAGNAMSPAHESAEAQGKETWSEHVHAFTERLGIGGHRAKWEEADGDVVGPLPDGMRIMDVVNESIDAMTDLITRYRMASNPPDVLIEVPADACDVMEFHRASELIALGRRLAVDALDAAQVRGSTARPAGTT